MNQDQFFYTNEGNSWFYRNKDQLGIKPDLPSFLIDLLGNKEEVKSIAELGCANGWRLDSLRKKFGDMLTYSGVDASIDAIEDGKTRYPGLNLSQGLLSDIPLQTEFDIVIVYFVFHWVDRSTLARSVSEVDRVVKEGGLLIIGDFLPDFQQKRHYHHCPGQKVYTYKQDYSKIFDSLGIYKEVARFCFDHEYHDLKINSGTSSSRGVCTVLKKSLSEFYPEVI